MQFKPLATKIRKVSLLSALTFVGLFCTIAYAETQDVHEPWTRKEAYRASTNQIVMHYGEGIQDVEIDARILTKEGYPAIAVPGGKPGQVELFIGRGKFGVYNQDDVDSGTLSGSAENFYKRKIGSPLQSNASSGLPLAE